MSDEADQTARQMSNTLADNIARLQERRAREAASAPLPERLAAAVTRFTGSFRFMILHLVLYGTWVAVNTGLVPGAPRFDRSFVMLATEASVEAIFLSTFVLISQNRMTRLQDRRADLDLHINLLAEHELTQLANLVHRIAERLGVEADNPRFHEIRKDVKPEAVMDALDEKE